MSDNSQTTGGDADLKADIDYLKKQLHHISDRSPVGRDDLIYALDRIEEAVKCQNEK